MPQERNADVDGLSNALFLRNQATGGSRVIDYEGWNLTAPVAEIREAIAHLKESDRTEHLMSSVRKALKRGLKRMKTGRASVEEVGEFSHDVVIWFANEVVQGRRAVEMQ